MLHAIGPPDLEVALNDVLDGTVVDVDQIHDFRLGQPLHLPEVQSLDSIGVTDFTVSHVFGLLLLNLRLNIFLSIQHLLQCG